MSSIYDHNGVFNDSKYTKWYYSIVKRCQERIKPDCYTEKHHILPKCLFPEFKNLNINTWNGVHLTSREHFICHWLLTKMSKSLSLKHAFVSMLMSKNNRKLSSKHYTILRENVSNIRKTNLEKIISGINKQHNKKYTYNFTKSQYTLDEYIDIICPIHGIFRQKVGIHLSGSGCAKCFLDKNKLRECDFVEKSIRKFGNRFDYTNINYENSSHEILLTCNIHNHSFMISPSRNLHSKFGGCNKCVDDRKKLQSIINKKDVHNVYLIMTDSGPFTVFNIRGFCLDLGLKFPQILQKYKGNFKKQNGFQIIEKLNIKVKML